MIKKIFAVCCVCALLTLACCGYQTFHPGRIAEAKTVQVESGLYTDKEINAAIKTAKRYFKNNFYDCKLLSIRYIGDEKADEMREWAAQYNADEAILLLSDFYVPENGGDGSLGYNQTYTGWNWILTRNNGGKWEHQDHGY